MFDNAQPMHALVKPLLAILAALALDVPVLGQRTIRGSVLSQGKDADVSLAASVHERSRDWKPFGTVDTDSKGAFLFEGVPEDVQLRVEARWSDRPNQVCFATRTVLAGAEDLDLGELSAGGGQLSGQIGIEDFRDGSMRQTSEPVIVELGLVDGSGRVFTCELDLSVAEFSIRGLPPRTYNAWFPKWPRRPTDRPDSQPSPFPLRDGGEASSQLSRWWWSTRIRVPSAQHILRAPLVVHSTILLACDEAPPAGRLEFVCIGANGVEQHALEHDGGVLPKTLSIPGPVPRDVYVLNREQNWGAHAELAGALARLVPEEFVPARGTARYRDRPFTGQLYLTLATAPGIYLWAGSSRRGEVGLPRLPRGWPLRISRNDPHADSWTTPPSRPFRGEILESALEGGVRVLSAR